MSKTDKLDIDVKSYEDVIKALFISCDDIIRILDYISCNEDVFYKLPVIQRSIEHLLVDVGEILKLVGGNIEPGKHSKNKPVRMSTSDRDRVRSVIECTEDQIKAAKRLRNLISHDPYHRYNLSDVWRYAYNDIPTFYQNLYDAYHAIPDVEPR